MKNLMAKLGKFMAGKGFYIVLLLCVTALGISGYYLVLGIGQTVGGHARIEVTATPAPTNGVTVTPTPTAVPPTVATATPSPAVTSAPTAEPIPTPTVTAQPTPTPQPTAVATATASVFTWPVKGEIVRGYAIETLAYDPTMADWRAHDGLDIACAVGTRVKAPAGGTVTDIFTDDMLGVTVSILHADGVESRCSNLAGVPTVEIGDIVRTGDIIGAVGESAIGESAEASHLHISMTKDGVSVDPAEYLP